MKAKNLFDPSHVKGIFFQTFDVKGTCKIKNLWLLVELKA
jgi:hypothetical protein